MKKTLDAVKMMRDIRAGLSRRYAEHPELLQRDLEAIRRKHGFPKPQAARAPRATHAVAEPTAPYRKRGEFRKD